MAQRRFHYEQAFESYLRREEVPYIAVDEAKRALQGAAVGEPGGGGVGARRASSLKSFDFVVYSGSGPNLLVDVKGRKHTGRSSRSLDNWVTRADVDSMTRWERLFGHDFEAVFVFLYWCQEPPPDALFQDVFEVGGRWYAALVVTMAAYRLHARQRSPRWGTVSMPAAQFSRRSVPLGRLL